LSKKTKKLRPPTKKRGLKERLTGVIDHEKDLWRKRDQRKLKKDKEKLAKLKEEEKRLDEKLKIKRLKDRVKSKRREASPVSGILQGIGKSLERVGKEAEGYTSELLSLDPEPRKKRKKPKKKGKKKKEMKKDPFPELPPL